MSARRGLCCVWLTAGTLTPCSSRGIRSPRQARRTRQLGGTHIPGTTRTFGGTSTAESRPLLFLTYPGPGFTPIHQTNDFRRVLASGWTGRR
jgi:hypothetical protein